MPDLPLYKIAFDRPGTNEPTVIHELPYIPREGDYIYLTASDSADSIEEKVYSVSYTPYDEDYQVYIILR